MLRISGRTVNKRGASGVGIYTDRISLLFLKNVEVLLRIEARLAHSFVPIGKQLDKALAIGMNREITFTDPKSSLAFDVLHPKV